jgi:hypothetical protein
MTSQVSEYNEEEKPALDLDCSTASAVHVASISFKNKHLTYDMSRERVLVQSD